MHRANKQVKKLSYMDKKIPQNSKYKGVQSKINSGNTIDKVKLISHKQYLQRIDEAFQRLTSKCLGELFEEYEDVGRQCSSGPEMVAKMVKDENGKHVMVREPASNSNNVSGPRIVSYEADEDVEANQPYLILDVRDPQEFEINRISRAKNFPLSHFNRDKLLPEMHTFKNKEGELIILYENDDRLATQAATALNNKGYDNVYVLTGGLAEFSSKYPSYCEGQLPEPQPAKNILSRALQRGTYKAPSVYSRGKAGNNNSVRSFNRRTGSSDVNSIADSMQSNLTVAESVISRATARKQRQRGSAR